MSGLSARQGTNKNRERSNKANKHKRVGGSDAMQLVWRQWIRPNEITQDNLAEGGTGCVGCYGIVIG